MAKAKTSGSDGASPTPAATAEDKKTDKLRPKKAKAGKSAGKSKSKSRARQAGAKSYDALVKLADHPLVADLIAIGAMAAVAALAGDKDKAGATARSTRKSVKAAGSAAAAAIGKRLLDEFSSSKKAVKKL